MKDFLFDDLDVSQEALDLELDSLVSATESCGEDKDDDDNGLITYFNTNHILTTPAVNINTIKNKGDQSYCCCFAGQQ